MERNKVVVTGLPGKTVISSTDLIMYFQSEKKSGGGEVTDIDDELLYQGRAILTFENEVVANRVLAREHNINGYPVQTAMLQENTTRRALAKVMGGTDDDDNDMSSKENSNSASDEEEAGDPEELCTVQVNGLSSVTTRCSIQNYFENSKKSKGGPVRKVEIIKSSKMAIVVFMFQQDAKHASEYTKHKLDDAHLRVSLIPPKPKGDRDTLYEGNGKTVRHVSTEKAVPLEFLISGISEITTDDTLVNYLENEGRSGGGDIDNLTFDREEGVALVKFQNVTSLDQLLSDRHRIDGANLRIEIKEPEKEIPPDPLKIHVKGLSSAITEDSLWYYLENMSKKEVEKVQFGSYGNALIAFKKAPDFEGMTQRIASHKKGLEGCRPTLERVPYCCCVQISGLDEKTTEDAIKLYFENRKKGCGVEPSKLDFQGQGRALVYFDDPAAVDRALRKEHELDKAKLKLEMFYPFLTEENPTAGKKSRRANEVKTIEVDPNIMAHVKNHYPDELQELLDDTAIELEWTPEETSAKMKGKAATRKKREPWKERVEMVQEYFDEFSCKKISVEPAIWDEVLAVVTKELVSTNDFCDNDITHDDSANEIRITGKKDSLPMVVSAVEALVSGKREDKALQDSIETQVDDNLEGGKLALLKISDLYRNLQSTNQHVTIEVDEDKGELVFQGPRKYIQEIRVETYMFFSKVKEEVLELPERVLQVLETPKGRKRIRDCLLENQTEAVIVHGQRKSKNEASIFAINKEQARKALRLIQSYSSEKSIHLNGENIQVINSQKWNELVSELEAQSLVRVLFVEQGQTLWISGIEPDAQECYKVLEDYIEKNTILTDIIEVRDGCSRFIFQSFDNEIQDLQAKMSDSFLAVRPNAGGEIILTGTRDGIEKGKEVVMSLVRRVCDEEVKIDKPGMKKFFTSSKGSRVIKTIEAENKCIVELVDMEEEKGRESGASEVIGSFNQSTDCEVICSYTTDERKKIVVYKDDLTRHRVDMIVNAANEDLQHVGGLAADIVRVGGQVIQDECDRYIKTNRCLLEGHVIETGPGKLPCKRIIHAVGPRWDSYRESASARKEGILQFAFENCLERAKASKSIAIPAVSSGIFGFPLDRCASILVKTAITFFQDNPSCNLSEVHLTNNDDMTVKAFADELRMQFGRKAGFTEGRPKTYLTYSQDSKTYSTRSLDSTSDKVLSTPDGISVFLKVGDISQEKADVLVNTAGEDLNLQNNACARSLSHAAGPQLQRYCNKIAPLKVGDIGVTKQGNLNCQRVFHAVCGDWNSGNGEKILRRILQKCLEKAETLGVDSIAIPAIGTGVLGFPRSAVARISLEEVRKFSKVSQPRNLKQVRFVLYDKDQLTVQAFRDEIGGRPSSSRNIKTPKKPSTPRKLNNPSLRRRSENWFEVDMDELTVQVQNGDITQEANDAIVVVSNPELDLEIGGGAGAAILRAGGPALMRECRQHPTLQPGDMSMTSAGSLAANKLIHYVPLSSDLSEAVLITAVLDCLRYAEQNGLSSISFPAIGTGNLGVAPDQCAKAMLKAFSIFSKQKPASLRLIRVVIFQKSMMKDFSSKLREFVGDLPTKNENTGLLRKFTDYIGLTTEDNKEMDIGIEPKESSEIVLRVYSGQQRHLDAAVKAITEMINENCQRKVINNDAIAYLEQSDVIKLRQLERQLDCKIQVEFPVCRIIVQGNNEDILSAFSNIHDILHEVKSKINKLEQAEIVAKDVQWQYESDDGFVPYSKEANAKIEQAYRNKEKDVTFEENDEKLKITFSRMTEESSEGQTKVNRKSLAQNDILPDYWDPQPKDRNGKEETVHLVDLDPRRNIREYLKVSDIVKKTLPSSNKITNIQRVQNPVQFKIYAVRKQKMDEDNSNKGSNEKMLFHGTSQESLSSINNNGFNRSYGGKNATVYGYGVYFAVDADYSARSNYSPPDSQGNRYMYLARVLTGEYTLGDQNMSVPPPKNQANPTVTYDTAVDDVSKPTIFVSFYDGQSYPEYLITFK